MSLNLLNDGTSIVSGWSDETIRFFNPKNGKKVN
jgi:WD40 repeat protein